MSDSWIRLIPTNPTYVPAPAQQEAARRLLATFTPHAQAVTARVYERVAFVDAGANLQRVSCPACRADLHDWWGGAVSSAAAGQYFDDLTVTTPCCTMRVSLNDLDYDWPVGFARFCLDAMNPNVVDLTADQIAAIAAALGHPLRRILRRI